MVCRVVMEGAKVESEFRYPLSNVTHGECKSFFHSLVKDIGTGLVLFSENILVVEISEKD